MFWAWLLGPLGALLAIPMTLLIKALLVDVDPTARWANALAGSLERQPPAPVATPRAEETEPAPEDAAAGRAVVPGPTSTAGSVISSSAHPRGR